MRRIWLLLICLAQPLLAAADVDIARIEIVAAADNAASQDLAASVRKTLQHIAPTTLEISIRSRNDYDAANTQGTLVIAIGDALLPWLTERKNDYAMAIAFLTSSAAFREEENSHKKITAIYRDQPLTRQLQLAKLLIPSAHRAAILRGSRELPQSIAELQEKSGLTLNEAAVDVKTEWAKQLSQLMQNNDFLLGIDDPQIYNGDTIRTILLTAYRHGKGLIGPSQAFVNAGSLASCHTSAELYLQQLADMVASVLRDRHLPAPQYAKSFRVVINKQVANSINLPLPDETTLSARLQNQSGECGDGC